MLQVEGDVQLIQNRKTARDLAVTRFAWTLATMNGTIDCQGLELMGQHDNKKLISDQVAREFLIRYGVEKIRNVPITTKRFDGDTAKGSLQFYDKESICIFATLHLSELPEEEYQVLEINPS